MKIGFIGTGVMGHAIVEHLIAAGHDITVYNRTKSKTDDLIAKGATWQDSPKAVTKGSELIFTMVGYPHDVEETYYHAVTGIFATDVKGKILVDLTTSTPSLAVKIAQTANENGAESLDAPVSGGDLGAKNGTLTIMAGGSEAAYQNVLPVFEQFGKTCMLHGGSGKGQHAKMANQIMIAGTMTGMTEMLVYANQAGLDLSKILDTLAGGSAANWSMINYSPRILAENYSPGFFVKHFVKDLKIALDEANNMGIDLPSTTLAEQLYEKLEKAGYGDDGTQALIKLWWQDGKKS
ncbi:3-hydroxyisobutyrate dehydrogenase [Enterococcus sp. DIV2402]|uniref:3-hydroxyisobutyrate dehydrogenase n=1 Tax=Candidatus Enterococcus lowellii TaxID=2230877 RepID=A0ABZ2SPL3_9ENTE|nr:NAD(P)-dependent oxidoreductase [Enterococcus sp. DIV2402]MBO0463535.1 NAD(P)-dependent oxidoreductase [Enterococcus sp. DIV2402]